MGMNTETFERRASFFQTWNCSYIQAGAQEDENPVRIFSERCWNPSGNVKSANEPFNLELNPTQMTPKGPAHPLLMEAEGWLE